MRGDILHFTRAHPAAGRPFWAACPQHSLLHLKTVPFQTITGGHKLLCVFMNFLSSPKCLCVRGCRSQARRLYHLQRQKVYLWPLRILQKLTSVKEKTGVTSASLCGRTLILQIHHTLKSLALSCWHDPKTDALPGTWRLAEASFRIMGSMTPIQKTFSN